MRTFGLDPGGTTGWSLFDREIKIDGGIITGGYSGFLRWARTDMPQHDRIVVEEFVVQPDFVGRAEASEILGAAFALSPAEEQYRQLRSLKATLVKGTESERVAWLRAHGFEGMIHELDADTHILILLKRLGDKAAFHRYWGARKSPHRKQ